MMGTTTSNAAETGAGAELPADRGEAAVARWLSGDEEAFADVVVAAASDLRASLAWRCADAVLVDEAAQEAFVFAYTHRQDFGGGSFSAWLRRIAHFKLRALLQQRARQQRQQRDPRLALALAANEDDSEDESDRAGALRCCVELLDEADRQLLNLRYRDGLGAAVIARRLNCSEIAVRTGLCRLRARLRACVERRLEQP